MSAGKVIAYIAAAILIFFGVLFIWGAFGASGQGGWLIVGVLSVAIGLVLVWIASRKPKPVAPVNVTYKVDLPGETEMETMKCKSCGGTLTADNIKMVNGAPTVTCPYCGSVYTLAEQPKW